MKRVFDKPFRKLISIYTLIFILLFTVCSSLNWLLTIYSKSIEVDSFAVFGIPIALSSLVTFLLFRKLVSRLNFDEKITSFTLWFLLPFPMAFSIAMSQKYFYDISYPVITIENPTEIQQYPDGRFFHIKNYFVVKDHFFCLREKHVTGKYGHTLVASTYYTSAMYDDSTQTDGYSTTAYGISFSAAFDNRITHLDTQSRKVQHFYDQSENNYAQYDFKNTVLFEKVFNSDVASYFIESWSNNRYSDKSFMPIVLIKKNETIDEICQYDWHMLIYSISICYGVTILFLAIFQFSNTD